MGVERGSVPEKFGIFGGTFDPPHIEHLLAAVEVRSVLALDRVLFVVANRPWQKVGSRSITDAALRLAMVERAVEGIEGLEASDIEIRRGGDSYTIDTLEELRIECPGAEFFIMVGADVEVQIPSWKSIGTLRSTATLVVVDRAGTGVESGPEDSSGWRRVERVGIRHLDVSSTELRARVAGGRPIDVLCPPQVVRFIARHGLYRVGDP